MAKLPDKPSELIELALKDLASVERSKAYKVDMGTWHSPAKYDGPCSVCLAGAVMARTLRMPRDEEHSPWLHGTRKMGSETVRKLIALDYFRSGDVRFALNNCKLTRPANLPGGVRVTPYSSNRRAFKTDMRRLARRLRAVGL